MALRPYISLCVLVRDYHLNPRYNSFPEASKPERLLRSSIILNISSLIDNSNYRSLFAQRFYLCVSLETSSFSIKIKRYFVINRLVENNDFLILTISDDKKSNFKYDRSLSEVKYSLLNEIDYR